MLPPLHNGYLWKPYEKLDSILGGPSGSRPRVASRGRRRPAEAKFFFGSNDSFWPQSQSLMVPDGVRPPQDPPAASRLSKASRGQFFWLKWFLVTSAWIPDGLWQCLWLFWYLVYCWTILGLYKVSTNKLGNLVMLVITTSFAFTNKPHGCIVYSTFGSQNLYIICLKSIQSWREL